MEDGADVCILLEIILVAIFACRCNTDSWSYHVWHCVAKCAHNLQIMDHKYVYAPHFPSRTVYVPSNSVFIQTTCADPEHSYLLKICMVTNTTMHTISPLGYFQRKDWPHWPAKAAKLIQSSTMWTPNAVTQSWLCGNCNTFGHTPIMVQLWVSLHC